MNPQTGRPRPHYSLAYDPQTGRTKVCGPAAAIVAVGQGCEIIARSDLETLMALRTLIDACTTREEAIQARDDFRRARTERPQQQKGH